MQTLLTHNFDNTIPFLTKPVPIDSTVLRLSFGTGFVKNRSLLTKLGTSEVCKPIPIIVDSHSYFLVVFRFPVHTALYIGAAFTTFSQDVPQLREAGGSEATEASASQILKKTSP